ncbi:hypothetical protein VL20_5999 [Microcystis panniformis FACHB-1757]|uniref:Uncharacterized protein n=1 Tax=Microcystis panniformis FACHB-1757 TaxID=1638788 RepID=A0A0K1S9G5_9CHRO|nr:hypothetical protein VL20_5999 [Microcystis panniformis FACHB-1757]
MGRVAYFSRYKVGLKHETLHPTPYTPHPGKTFSVNPN